MRKKSINFTIALFCYGLFWLAGYNIMLKHNPFGIGEFVFGLFHVILQLVVFGITMTLIFGYKKGRFSFFSFLSLLCNSTMLYFLLAYPRSIEDVTTRAGFISVAIIFFLIHLYTVFRKPKAD